MQIFVIHGGDAFASYEEYLDHLKNWKLDLNRLRGGRDWKSTLSDTLGEGYDVFTPTMPNARNAKYAEWKIWFEKFIPFMEDSIVLIGHSLGGLFLAKYLSEEIVPKKICAVFLIAPPFDSDGDRAVVEFVLPQSLDKLSQQGGHIFLYHSTDDPVVAFSEHSKYEKALPTAKSVIFQDRGHFNQETFPEVVAQIKAL